MKDSKEYSKKIRKLHRELKRKHAKPDQVYYDEPLDALVYAMVSGEMSVNAAAAALKRFAAYFVDVNDLRVSRPAEIADELGEDTAGMRATALMLTRTLNAVFYKYHTASLMPLKKTGKKPARQILEKLDGITPFAIDYCMLTSLAAHAVPLTERMIEYLKANELVDPEADDQQIRGFLARQISAERGYEFYAMLRRESEARRVTKKKKTVRKVKKVVAKSKKTKKKTATKKKTTKKRTRK